jgi:UDP-N-acetylglucosamine 2-epimerase (non-hydrolysing)
MKKLISIVFGTRPELIKLAPVILLAQQDPRFQVEVIFTGQHDELVRDAIEFFQIKIDQRLQMMNAGQSLNQLLIQGLSQLEQVFNDGKQRDAVIIQGDTTTVLAAGLVAFSMKIPVAHVEAGLRSFNMDMRSVYLDTELMLVIRSKEINAQLGLDNAYTRQVEAFLRASGAWH